MAFLSLSDIAKAYIILLSTLTVIILVIVLIAYIVEKNKGTRIAVLASMLIASMLDFSVLSQLNKVNRTKYDISLTQALAILNNIPYLVHIIMNLVFILVAILSLYSLYKNSNNKINTFSVKEALENLPTGIAFTTKKAELLLSNHIIHNLCIELTGKSLLSAEAFWQDLSRLQAENCCVIKGEMPAFTLIDGSVWQFSKTLCIYNNDEYYEFKATDISQLYNLIENTRIVNEKLTQQQHRLKELTSIIEENAESCVALNMKINFHDNFGNLLTLTKKALRESENINEARTLVDYWGNLNKVIKELSSNDKQVLTLEQIVLFANKLCCEIILDGELPKEEHNNITTLLCINEMLKNAYRHAGAQKLMVNIFETDSIINLTINNETEHKLSELKEGGGLTGLRERIEKTGGSMKMTCEDGVTMFVKLLKGDLKHV